MKVVVVAGCDHPCPSTLEEVTTHGRKLDTFRRRSHFKHSNLHLSTTTTNPKWRTQKQQPQAPRSQRTKLPTSDKPDYGEKSARKR